MSSMFVNLQIDETYELSKMIEVKPIPFWLPWMYRMMVPLMIPRMMLREARRRIDKNPLHDGKRHLTGQKKVAMSPRFKFAEIKATSKALGVTINELLTSALWVAIK